MREPDFEISADMRLLELQRGALGLPPRERLSWESRAVSEGSIPMPPPPDVAGTSAVLAVEANAVPREGVIAGAQITITLSVANEGAVIAEDITVIAPLPGGAAYRPGSFIWNGRSTFDDVADTFFTAGLEIGGLGPGERATFQWKIGVKLGSKALVVAPHVRAGGVAVIGGRPLVISRKEQAASAFTDQLSRADLSAFDLKPLIPVDIATEELPPAELPIYELDSEESLIYEATDETLSARVLSPAAGALMQPVAVAEEPPPTEEPPPIPVGEPPESEPMPAREAIVLYGRFDRATVAFFERTFESSKPPALLQHCIFAGALACAVDGSGNDAWSLKRHLDAQSGVLHRVVLHEKLGKREPIAEYAGELLAHLETLVPQPVGDALPAGSRDALVLCSELPDATRQVVQRIADESGRWDFVKARQLTLALQAQSVATPGIDADVLERVEASLRAYAQASVTVLQKLFVRIRIDRTTGLLFASDPSLDVVAKNVVASLKAALG